MLSSTVLSLGLALFAFSGVNAYGAAHVTNLCNFPIWCGKSVGIPPGTKPPPNSATIYKQINQGQSVTESLSVVDGNPGGAIICKKYGGNEAHDTTALEYEIKDGRTWFDTSNVNGVPFQAQGLRMTVNECRDSGRNINCYCADCPASDKACPLVYNYSKDDNHGMRDCSTEVDINLYLCGTGPKDAQHRDNNSPRC
jgi:hypothetical protein